MTAANPLVSTESWATALMACPKLVDLQAARRTTEAAHQRLHNSRMTRLTAAEDSRRASSGPNANAAARRFLQADSLVNTAERAVQAAGDADEKFRGAYRDLLCLPVPDAGTLFRLADAMAARGIRVKDGAVILPEGIDLVI